MAKTVRNRGHMHPMQLHTISMYNSPLCMASVRKNYSLTVLVHLIYVLFKVVYLTRSCYPLVRRNGKGYR